MDKQYFVGFRLSKEEYLQLGALVRKSGKKKSEVVRELLAKGYVKERIKKEHVVLLRQLTGEATNLNQLARKANTFGFHEIAGKCDKLLEYLQSIIKQIRNDR